MEKNLVNEVSRFPSIPVPKMDTLKPLSLSIKSVPMTQVTYSDILNSLISDASSAMCAPYLEPHTPLKSMNRSSYENLPFLRPPLTPERTKIPSDNIHTTPVAKRMLTSPTSEFSSPSKRSRLLDSAPFRSPLSKKKLPKHLAGDVVSLLQSPPIPRRNSKHSKSTPTKNSPVMAPQGILKKKPEPAKHPSSDFFTSKTPSVLSDAGEDSDAADGDDIEMNVDLELDDNPARQIRFSVPSKEDLNTSTYSNMSAESAISRISHESSDLIKKLEELRPLPSSEPVHFSSKELINVTQRKTLLTREPLKSHSRISPEKSLLLNEHNKLFQKSEIPVQEVPALQSTSLSSKESLQRRNIEAGAGSYFVEASDSDSSASDNEPKNENYATTSVQSSNLMHSSPFSSTTNIAEQNLITSATNTESLLNKSGSSSGNSSYNSAASDRSFIVTPRKPLRDKSRNEPLASTSMVAAEEGDKNQAVLGKPAAPEEMIIDDTDDDDDIDDDSISHHTGVEEEVSIIGEVPVPLLEKKTETISQPMEEEDCICVDSDSEKAESHSAEKTCNQDLGIQFQDPISEESLDIQPVFDSHEEISTNQVNENQERINNNEQSDFQNDFYNAEHFVDVHNQVAYMEEFAVIQNQISDRDQFEVYQNSSAISNDNVEQSSDIQNQIEFAQQCSGFQSQIVNTDKFTENQNQIISLEQPGTSNQNQVSSAEYVCDNWSQINIKTNIQTCNLNTIQTCNTDIQISSSNTNISACNSNTDIQTCISNTDIQNLNPITDIQIPDSITNIQTPNPITDTHKCNINSDIQTYSSNIDMPFIDTKTDAAEVVKDDINEKNVVENVKEYPSDIDNMDDQTSKSSEHAVELVQQKNITEVASTHESVNITEVTYTHESVIKGSNDVVATEVHVDESTESCSSEVFNIAKDAPVSSVPEYVPIKERISRSHQSVSRSSKFDDEDDDQNYPSLLLQEQMELEKYGDLCEDEKLVTSKYPSSSKSEKLESIAESSKAMETDFEAVVSVDLMPAASTATKDISQRLNERFEFLSKNSEFCENNKLYRDTMALLKSDMPLNLDYDTEMKSSRKTRTFVFKKEVGKPERKTAKSEELEQKANKEIKPPEKFLESWHPETYEQFSSSLQTGKSDADQKESLKSSPNMDIQKSSISIFGKVNESMQSSSKTKGKKKRESGTKDSSLVDKKERSSVKKTKGKGKKKMEFSFAEPHSPAGPEVLEALTTPSQYPVESFMFSPPVTRRRLRQKRMDDTLGSSFASVASDTSFAKEKKPPVDPILQGIIDERAPETQKIMTPKKKTRSSPKKKSVPKTSEKTDAPALELTDLSLDTSHMIPIHSPMIDIRDLPSRQTIKHRMVLRQTKAKPRTEQLF